MQHGPALSGAALGGQGSRGQAAEAAALVAVDCRRRGRAGGPCRRGDRRGRRAHAGVGAAGAAEGCAAPSGPLDGTWRVSAGSVAGFRVREAIIGFSNDVTGRTGDVTGTMVLADAQVSRAAFQVSLGAITVDGKTRQPQLVRSLGVTAHPDAAITLTRPTPLPAAFASGAVITRTAAATLTLDGTSRPVTVILSARRDGMAIEAAGSLPVAFTGFRITGPGGLGFFRSLASAGAAEFLLILRPQQGGGG
jgi:polyisoprenoid-binding protein YceI